MFGLHSTLLLGSLLLLTTPVFAKTIIAVFQKRPGAPKIVMGADGLQRQVDSNTGKIAGIASCKIMNTGSYYYSVAGIVYSPDHSYDVYRALTAALAEPEPVGEQIKYFETTVLSQLNSLSSWPSGVDKVIEVLLIDSAKFPWYYLGAFVAEKDRWSVDSGSGIRTSFPDDIRTIALGTAGAAKRAFINKPYETDPGAAVRRIKAMITIEELHHPEAVGEPTSIVEFTQSGVRWILPGACK